jgi:glycosyltransferase involved in cell wall biosynthesis
MSGAPRRHPRVGIVVPGFSASEQDWCIPALLDLVRVLSQQADLRVLSLRYPETPRTYVVHGAGVRALGAGQARGAWARLRLTLRGLQALLQAHRQRPFDVLHAFWAHEPGALAALAGALLRVPVVVSVLGGELTHLRDIQYGGAASALNERLIAFALRRATRLTVGSDNLRTLVAARALWDPRWRVWPLGVDTQRFCPGSPGVGAPILDGSPALLSVAALTPVKDPETLLRAFALARARRPGARLHVVGQGVLSPLVREWARDLNLGAALRLHGPWSHERLVELYRQADALVVSSRFESQSMVALEAAACGCPSVGTQVGLLPELFPGGLVSPGDVPALAECLVAVPAGRASAGRGTELAEYVALHHGLERRQRELLALYGELAANGGG